MRIVHRVSLADPQAHLIGVETTIQSEDPLPDSLELIFAVWTPGSYLVREYARHVEQMECVQHTCIKVRKNAWIVNTNGAREVTVRYRVYCGELTVRTNHVDASHVYLNGAPTFVVPKDHLDAPTDVHLDLPTDFRVATALERLGDKHFRAKNFDTLVDSPIEAGHFREEKFEAASRAHAFAIWPEHAITDPNVARLIDGAKTIIETEARLFGGELPHDGYTFILHLSPRSRGGLEHMASSSLIAPESAFDSREGFLDLLSLISHEYFHLWSVKRIRPAGLFPYRYEEENYTRLLWWFEGATSYFDWRVLRVAKLCTVDEYLEHLATEIAYLETTPGRLVHPLEAASFDAWIKLYRPDENSPSSTVSYYRKGELVNAIFDLEIRARSQGRASLDDVMLHLWKNFGARNVPVPEDGMQKIFEDVAGVSLRGLFDGLVRSAHEVDIDGALRHAGLVVERAPRGESTASLGVRVRGDSSRLVVTSAFRGAAAQRAGIDAGDEMIAIAGKRIEGSLDIALAGKQAGEIVPILISRDGRVQSIDVKLDVPRLEKIRITIAKDATEGETNFRRAWLGD